MILDALLARAATPQPTSIVSPTITSVGPIYSSELFWVVFGSIIALVALLVSIHLDYVKPYMERGKAERVERERKERATLEAAKAPRWAVSLVDGDFTKSYFELAPMQEFANGRQVSIPIYVKNIGERSSGTFQVELYIPRTLELHGQTDSNGGVLKTKSNVSPFPGMETYEIRFRSLDKDLRPGEYEKLGTFSFFFMEHNRTVDFKLYWRLTSQANGYVYPPAQYAEIGVTIALT